MYTIAYLGMQQIVIILVIALLIFGPQKVPELGRQIGGALRDLKKMSNEVQSAFDLDDHTSYDRYEPPTYEYTPPVSTTYGHEPMDYHQPMDQVGLTEAQHDHPAIEATIPNEATPTSPPTTVTAELPLAPTVTHHEVAPVLETETTTHAPSADAAAKSA